MLFMLLAVGPPGFQSQQLQAPGPVLFCRARAGCQLQVKVPSLVVSVLVTPGAEREQMSQQLHAECCMCMQLLQQCTGLVLLKHRHIPEPGCFSKHGNAHDKGLDAEMLGRSTLNKLQG